jgi:hypothetical protein
MKPAFQLFHFYSFEVHGCKEFHLLGLPSYTEQVEDEEAQFWTVYGHYSPESGHQGAEALVHCTDRHSAELVQKLLTVILEAHIDCWVANAAITSDIETLRRICLAHANWWNFRASKVLS